MGLGPQLQLRQSQSLVMTPQLQQAIKLLALSNLEIEAFIGEVLDANPLLEIDSGAAPAAEAGEADARRTTLEDSPVDRLIGEGRAGEDAPLDIDPAALDRDRDTGEAAAAADAAPHGEAGIDAAASNGPGGEAPGIDEHGGGALSLAGHLHAQLGAEAALRLAAPRVIAVARFIVDMLDEAGYLPARLEDIADDLAVPRAEAEVALALVQSLDPTGVGARTLAECIALQAKEADRYDPAMARMIANLDMVARGDLARLRRLCGVDEEDFADMLGELRGYDPKPGLAYGSGPADPVTPDVLITARGGDWVVSLNEATLPRLVVNRSYYTEVRGACGAAADKGWLSEKLADARWLIKALDQRQRTILKVASELVRQQEGFFRGGVAYLKPLTLRAVAEAVGLHESTVSRVTSNKYLMCARGTFELKYFFSSGVGSADGEGGASAAAVKAAIRQLIDGEDARAILSDDTLVDLLRARGFDLARRTVAKYREAIGIGSSVQRRRQKATGARR